MAPVAAAPSARSDGRRVGKKSVSGLPEPPASVAGYFQSERQNPTRLSVRPAAMFLARRATWPVRMLRPVALSRAARYRLPVRVRRPIAYPFSRREGTLLPYQAAAKAASRAAHERIIRGRTGPSFPRIAGF